MIWRGRRRGWLRLLALCAVLGHGGLAHASTEQVRKRLRVQPGATCLTTEKLAAEVERLLDGTPIADDFLIFVEGGATDPRSVHLRIVRHEGTVAERDFEPGPERCSHLHAAVGLAISLAIKASQAQEPPPAREWSLAAAGLWTYRLLPQIAPGAELDVRRAFGEHALVRAGVLGAVAFGAALGQQADAFDATLVAARVDGCARMKLASGVQADGCAGVLGGALFVAGAELARPKSSVVPWIALSAAAELELELAERWSLALGLSAMFLLHRVEVGTEDASGTPVESRTLGRPAFAVGLGPVYYF